MESLIILGNGPAGCTAAVYAARARLDPLVLTGSLPGGQLTQTTDIENYPGFPEPINGFELMMLLQRQAERFGARFSFGTLAAATLAPGGPQELTLTDGATLAARALIIATGAVPRWLGLPAEERLKGKGVTACATCDGAFYRDVPVVVIGGGDTAMEEALFLTRFASKVTVIHRRDQLRASKIMADRALTHPKIEFAWNSVVEDILGDNAVAGVRLRNVRTDAVTDLPCQGYFAALGHVPSTEPFKGQLAMDDAGYLLIDDASSRTSIPGVFAAGDCADHVYRQAITAAGMGCRAAIDAERWLEANPAA
jgi:thioredoxin reductase (NADPH)